MTKYRGLRLDGKGWVEGYYGVLALDTDVEKHVIMVSTLETQSSLPYFYFTDIEVHKDSIGVAVGLPDKNGKEIFGSIPIDGVMSKGGDRIQVITDFIGNVKFRNGGFIIINETEQFYYIGELISNLSYEIIGNQYEQTQQP